MTVAQLRTLIPDKPQFDRAAATGDAASTQFELPNAPVIAGTLSVRLDGTLQTEGADYTVDLGLGLVTFTSAPAADAAITMAYQHTLLSDADLQTMLDLSPSVLYATAQAIDTIAVDQLLVLKVIRLLDVSTDGAAMARALRDRAKSLRDQDDAAAGADSFDIAEWAVTPFAAREILVNEWLRELA